MEEYLSYKNRKLLKKLTNLAVDSTAGGVAFYSSLTAFHYLQGALRVSAASPFFLPSWFGLAAVVTGSIVAGQVYRIPRKILLVEGRNLLSSSIIWFRYRLLSCFLLRERFLSVRWS